MAFYVGQKVVCVDDSPPPGFEYYRMEIKIGEKYVVSGDAGPSFLDGAPTIFLEGIRPDVNTGFWSRRFRPIVEKKTDISIFTAMLHPKHLRTNVEALEKQT